MKKIACLAAALLVMSGAAKASAEGIMVNDAGLNFAQDSQYLSAYKDTQVTDIIISNPSDGIPNGTTENLAEMGINAWYKYEISSTEELDNINAASIPDGIYGIELDFVGETSLVENGRAKEIRAAVNESLRKIRQTAGDRRIAVKLPSDFVIAYDNGLDIYTWSDEKLADMYLLAPYHNGVETDMSPDLWRSIIDSNIEIACVIGTYMNTPAAEDRSITLENVAALSNAYLSAGADKIYLENFVYRNAMLTYEPFWETELGNKSAADTVIRECGSLEALRTMNKRFIVSNSRAVGNHSESQNYDPLPLTNNGAGFSALRIKTGNISEESDIKLLIGCTAEDGRELTASDLTVFMNGSRLEYEFTAGGAYLKPGLSDGTVMIYSVDGKILNDINQVIELKSNAYINGEHMPITVDYVELREDAGSGLFIYRNMSNGENRDGESGRYVLNAPADSELSYEVEADGDGIYALSVCYKSDTEVDLTLNGREYTLPSHSAYTAYGFASINLKKGKNTITFKNNADISYNYFVLTKADEYLTRNGEELITLENGNIVANAKLSGLMRGQDLVLLAALYDGETLENVYYDKQTIDTDNYILKVPFDVDMSGSENYSLKIFLWNNLTDINAYANVKIYE